MGKPIDDEYASWFSPLFPSYDYVWVGSVSVGVSVGLFALGYVVGEIGNFNYLLEPEGYLGAFGVFWMLTWLGLTDDIYVDVWNDVRPAFAVDDESYSAVVHPRLERIYDERRILAYTAVLAIPYFLIVAAIYAPGSPLREPAIDVFLAGGCPPFLGDDCPYAPSILRVVEFYLLGTPNALLVATIINGFMNHLSLVGDVSELPFRNLYTSTSDLESVARFTIASSTVWFAGISLIILWIGAGVSSVVGTAIIALLVFVGVVFFLAPQLILHDAILDAKREALTEIREEYEEMHQLTQMEAEPSDNLSLRLELTDRRLQNVKSIRTWVYDLSSVGKLVVASVIPWLKLVQEIVLTGQML